MKKYQLILFQTLLSLLLISSFAFAAPDINDGYMSYIDPADWGGLGTNGESTVTNFPDGFDSETSLTNVSVEEGEAYGDTRTNNNYYDVEELGVYIDDNMLYIGLQTNFDLVNGGANGTILAGDFIFNFDDTGSDDFAEFAEFASDNTDADDFALSFTINSQGEGGVDFELLAGNIDGASTPIDNYGTDWEITNWSEQQSFAGAGTYTQGNTNDSDPYPSGNNTIEAAIDLSQLQGDLLDIFTSFASTSVTMYWQPSCGNDFLAARTDFAFTPNDEPSPTPEPATLLLFGMGLLGAGAYGRKRQKQEEE